MFPRLMEDIPTKLSLSKYFSEYAYIYYRLKVEIEYLDRLLDKLDKNTDQFLKIL